MAIRDQFCSPTKGGSAPCQVAVSQAIAVQDPSQGLKAEQLHLQEGAFCQGRGLLGLVPSLAPHSIGLEVVPLELFPLEGYMCADKYERIIKGTWQLQSHLHVKGASSGREAHFGEETC